MDSYSVDELYKIYSPQYGGSLEERLVFYKPNLIRQRGSGLGSFLMNIGRKLIPLVKKFILPHAKTALQNVANEVLHNDGNLVESLKKNSLGALKGIGNQIINQSGSGTRRQSIKRKGSPLRTNPPKRRKTCKEPIHNIFI